MKPYIFEFYNRLKYKNFREVTNWSTAKQQVPKRKWCRI